MVNIIIGENASGKTKILRGMYNKLRGKSVSNFVDDNKSKYILLSEDKLNLLKECFIIDEIKNTDNSIMYIEYNNVIMSSIVEQPALDILSLICKKYNNVYLDEPERGVGTECLKVLAQVLCEFKDVGNIWITTHTIHFSNIEGAKYFKVSNNSLEELSLGEVYECIDEV